MSRQNRTSVRDRESEEPKRDVAYSNDRYSSPSRDEFRNKQNRDEVEQINGLDTYRLNDLYERSSI